MKELFSSLKLTEHSQLDLLHPAIVMKSLHLFNQISLLVTTSYPSYTSKLIDVGKTVFNQTIEPSITHDFLSLILVLHRGPRRE